MSHTAPLIDHSSSLLGRLFKACFAPRISRESWIDVQAKFFTEVRLLQRPIKVRLLSAPASLGAPPSMGSAKSNGNGLPALPQAGAAATNIIGTA